MQTLIVIAYLVVLTCSLVAVFKPEWLEQAEDINLSKQIVANFAAVYAEIRKIEPDVDRFSIKFLQEKIAFVIFPKEGKLQITILHGRGLEGLVREIQTTLFIEHSLDTLSIQRDHDHPDWGLVGKIYEANIR